ncbi:hypothetical protein [Arcobacter sp. FWKO B]|uniref:hypothetical protein n=1 Tax=Arcobacter sp. FWKO B TaxID=2593672 RepID=UPI0018A50844|nr:hypothetical protein [Arcobacter sp. FWKO B]QOG12988.1 hypothetical protein FWKOB_09940 [Arcobacter sp. FWKO B]
MRRNIINYQIIVFFTSFIAVVINLIASTHFIALTFAGVVFYASLICFQKKLYYSLFFVLVAFLVIETTQGLKPFSLILISFILYSIILPIVKRFFSVDEINKIIDVVLFYILVTIIYYISNGYLFIDIVYLLLNIVIDIAIVGLFL